MSKPIIVLADLDANYLTPIEDKLTEELYDQIELEIITSKEYFDFFFSTPRKIDTLIVSSSLFSKELQRHNITGIYVLTENSDDTKSTDNITCIFKYSSTQEILNQILSNNKEMLDVRFSHKETQVVVVTSSIGGSGKTTLALALSESLARSHKRVLFISTDIMQSFSYYLQNKSGLPNDIVRVLNRPDEKLYAGIMSYFRNEGFSYLPPFERNIFSIGLDSKIYNRIVAAAKAAKDFDYVIVDTELNLDESKAEMIQNADKVIINVLQDSFSTYKTEHLVRNIDCTNTEKFIFVCNKFRRDLDNKYIASQIGQKFIITEYVDEVPMHKINSLDSFVETSGIKDLAFLFD